MKRWGQRLLESQETEKASSRSQLLHQRFEKSSEYPSVSALPRSCHKGRRIRLPLRRPRGSHRARLRAPRSERPFAPIRSQFLPHQSSPPRARLSHISNMGTDSSLLDQVGQEAALDLRFPIQEFHCFHVRLAWTRRGRAGHATLGSSRDAPPIDGCVTWFCQESLANASSPSPQRAGGRTRPH